MPIPIIHTKLVVPQPNKQMIEREHLNQLLDTASGYKLVLVSSSAGSGKSTLIAHYVERARLRCFWYALDNSDDDIIRFSAYLLKGLESNKNISQSGFQALLESLETIGEESFIKAIINWLCATKEEFTMIFDDYHVIHQPEIHHMMALLLEYMPAHIHVILMTREDPPLPLSKWRVKNQLLEIRIRDLKFTDIDAERFLNESMMLKLTSEDTKSLNTRVEGWIAGLQLAALFMRDHPAKEKFVQDFSGNHFYVMDYLLEEVLQQQPPHIKEFLLCTSILEQFCGSLCDAVLELSLGTAQKTIEHLLKSNTFLIALDYQHTWFRYHHLFRDLLLQKCKDANKPIQLYHRLASRWFYENNRVTEAIHHALSANDIDFAADMIEGLWAEMDQTVQGGQWLKLAKRLPDEVIRKRPVLNVGYAWALIDTGDIVTCVERLEQTQRQIELSGYALDGKNYVVFDQEQFQMLPALIATAYTYIAAAKGDSEDLQYANQALKLLGDRNYLRKGIVQMLMSFSYWRNGELLEAMRTIQAGLFNIMKAEHQFSISSFELMLSEVKIELGYLSDAENSLNQAISSLEDGVVPPFALASMYLKLSEISLLRGDVASAAARLKNSREKGAVLCLPDFEYKWRMMASRLLAYQNEFTEAIASIDKAVAFYHVNPIPEHITTNGLRARFYLQNQQSDRCHDFFHQATYATEQDRLVFTRYLLTTYVQSHDESVLQQVSSILTEMLAQAQLQHRTRSIIDIDVQIAIVQRLQNDMIAATNTLKAAMALAAPERYVFPFIDYFEMLSSMYQELLSRKEIPDFLFMHVSQLVQPQQKSGASSHTELNLLSPRELDVLRLMAEGCSNQEICDTLFLALSTIKGYNQNIYDKLGVKRRTEAIAKAREFGILA